MKPISLIIVSTLALTVGISAKAQTFDLDFSFTNNQSVSSAATGTVTISGGKATQLVLNPFIYNGNNGNTIDLPTLTWTQNTVGTDEGTFAIGNNSASVSGGTVALNVTGTSIPVTVGAQSASVSFTFDTASNGVTDFSGGYPFGTQFFTFTSADVTTAPEPPVVAFALSAVAVLAVTVRRRLAA